VELEYWIGETQHIVEFALAEQYYQISNFNTAFMNALSSDEIGFIVDETRL